MRDQLLGLSYAMLATGVILTVAELLILDSAVFAKVAPFVIGPLVAGAAGVYVLKFRGGATSVAPTATSDEPAVQESSEDA